MFLRKGISIPINTLVMLAIAIIVLLATVAWFMGAFAPTATQQKLQTDFRNSCSYWVNSNCDGDPSGDICIKYNRMITGNPDNNDANCDKNVVAAACGCSPPFGRTKIITTTTTTVESTTTTTVCTNPDTCNGESDCCPGYACDETSHTCVA